MVDSTAYFIDEKKFSKLNTCLNYLFKNKYTRFSKIDNNIEFNSDTLQLACQIYKRGIPNEDQKFKNKITIKNEYKKPNILFLNKDDFLLKRQEHQNVLFFNIVDIFFSPSDKTETTFYLEATEKNKNLETVSKIISHIQSLEYKKEITHIIALGGGITLDIAGFVASLTQKKLLLIPTTLLSMIDATIGGKTGVNFEPYGKNQVGSFYFCDEIIIAPHFLNTLPHHEIISGLCEALKHSWISGDFLEHKKEFEQLLSFDTNKRYIRNEFILDNLNTKIKIVAQDPYERTNFRSVLNFGHTIGHALETLTSEINQKIPHGIAVAHGMLFVLTHYYQKHTNDTNEFIDFLKKITKYFPVDLRQFSIESWSKVLVQDKKNKNNEILSFCLPNYGFLKNYTDDISTIKDVGMKNVLETIVNYNLDL